VGWSRELVHTRRAWPSQQAFPTQASQTKSGSRSARINKTAAHFEQRLSHIRKQNWHSNVPDDRTNPAVVQRRRSMRSESDRQAFRQHFRERDLRGVNEISVFRFIVHQALGLPSCTWRASRVAFGLFLRLRALGHLLRDACEGKSCVNG